MARRDAQLRPHSMGFPQSGPSDQQARRSVAVLIVDTAGLERLDALLEIVTESEGWSSSRGSILVWQIEPPSAEQGLGGGADPSAASRASRAQPAPRDALQKIGRLACELEDLEDGSSLRAGTMHFVPAHRALRFEGPRVRLEAAAPGPGRTSEIDRLLLSLAESWGERCISVLAFAGADEAGCGARIVRGVGGLVLRQVVSRAKPLSRREPEVVAVSDSAAHRSALQGSVAELRAAEPSTAEVGAAVEEPESEGPPSEVRSTAPSAERGASPTTRVFAVHRGAQATAEQARSDALHGADVATLPHAATHPERDIYPEVAMPLIACDADERVAFISRVAMAEFRLLPVDVGCQLAALAGRLPGDVELMLAARRVRDTGRGEELSVRYRGRAFLASIGAGGRGTLSIAYADVTAIEVARARAVAEQHRQAALARLSELGANHTTAAPLYEETLAALFGNIHHCSAGIVVELAGGARPYEVVASRGLGADPLRTLRGMIDGLSLLDEAVARECVVSQYGARVPLEPASAARDPRNARAQQARAALTAGLACPILADGHVLGVFALLGRDAGLDSSEQRAFASSVAAVLGAALLRHRARRGLDLELAVRRELSSITDTRGLGEGLARAFESTLGVSVELWWARDERLSCWQRLSPPGGEGLACPSGSELVATAASGSIVRAVQGDRGEVLVPVAVNTSPCLLLRLRGAAPCTIDDELEQSLKRVAAMLGACLRPSDRQRCDAR